MIFISFWLRSIALANSSSNLLLSWSDSEVVGGELVVAFLAVLSPLRVALLGSSSSSFLLNLYSFTCVVYILLIWKCYVFISVDY